MIYALLGLQVAVLCVTLMLWYGVARLLVREQERTDRYAAALQSRNGESRAAAAILPRKEAAAPPDGRTRPRQVGLQQR